MPRYKYHDGDIIGPFNTLLVKRLEKTSLKDPHKFGLFKCSFCEDGYFEARISEVVKGSVKSCGCFHRKQAAINGARRAKDISGQTFGYLTAIRPMPKDNPQDSYTWECICNSPFHSESKTCYAKATLLIQGHVKSCGCLLGKMIKDSGEVISYGALAVKNVLIDLGINYIQEYTFPDCKNPKTNQRLRFDFYLPDYNCCIEYDGEQHFSPSKGGWNTIESYKAILYRDSLKTEYCLEKGIHLIRIPFTDKNKISVEYILNLLSDDWRTNEV